MHNLSLSVGNFLFRHRNWVFPICIACVFAIGVPPAQSFGSEAIEHVKDGFAILIAAAGLVLRGLVIGHRYVRRSGEKKSIHADELFTSGMFSLCRNPLYTGNVMILSGIFLMHGNPYAVVIGPALFLLVYRLIIAAEETYLLRAFGQSYAGYCAAVPRWLPDLRCLPAILRGKPFSLRRVFIVEYTNIGLTVIALALVEFVEELTEPLTGTRDVYITSLMTIMILGLGWIGVMRLLKKKGILITP